MRMTSLNVGREVGEEGRDVNECDRARAWEMSAGYSMKGLVGGLRQLTEATPIGFEQVLVLALLHRHRETMKIRH